MPERIEQREPKWKAPAINAPSDTEALHKCLWENGLWWVYWNVRYSEWREIGKLRRQVDSLKKELDKQRIHR